ncbi:hypothetical protein [Stomatohabitans albus]|uniref:hypothetical protein n=1 Tax=Stomatohabitans albus TaxID=3110766 RepID=UPI00300C51C3
MTTANLPSGEIAALLNSIELSRRAVQSLLNASEQVVEQAQEAAVRIGDASSSGAKRVDAGAQRAVDQLQLALIERAEEFDRSINRVMNDLASQIDDQSGRLVHDNRAVLDEIQERIVSSLLEAQEGIADVTRSVQARIWADSERLERRLDDKAGAHVEQVTGATKDAVSRVETAVAASEQASADAALRIGQTAERITEGSRQAVERMLGESDQVSGRIEAATSGAVRELKSAARGYAEHLDATAELIASHLAQTKGAAEAVAQITRSTVDETVINATENVLVAVDRVEAATNEQIDRLVGATVGQIEALEAITQGQAAEVGALEARLHEVVSEVITRINDQQGHHTETLSDASRSNHRFLTEAVAQATRSFAESVNVNASAIADAMSEATDQLAARVADEMAELPHQWRRAASDAGRVMSEQTVAEIERLRTQIDSALVSISQAGERTAGQLEASGSHWTRHLDETLDALVDELNRSATVTEHAARTFSASVHTSIEAASGVLGEQVDTATQRMNTVLDQVTVRASDVAGDQIERVTKIARELRDTADRSTESVLDALGKLSGQSVLLDAALEQASTTITQATADAGYQISNSVRDAGDYLVAQFKEEVAGAQRAMQAGSQQVADRMVSQNRDIEVRITQRADEIISAMAERDTELAVWAERFYGAVDTLEGTADGLASDRDVLAHLARDVRAETTTALDVFTAGLDGATERTGAAIGHAAEQTAAQLADLVNELERRLGLELERLVAPVRTHLAQVSEQQRRLAVVMDRMEQVMTRREEAIARDEAIADRMLELVEDSAALVEQSVGERAVQTLGYLQQAERTGEQLELGGQEAANMLVRLTQATERLAELSATAEATRQNLDRTINRALPQTGSEPYSQRRTWQPTIQEPIIDYDDDAYRISEREQVARQQARQSILERLEANSTAQQGTDLRGELEPRVSQSRQDESRRVTRPVTSLPGGRRTPPPRWAPPRRSS